MTKQQQVLDEIQARYDKLSEEEKAIIDQNKVDPAIYKKVLENGLDYAIKVISGPVVKKK